MRKLIMVAAIAFVSAPVVPSQAATMQTIYSFCKKGVCPDGASPTGVFAAPSGEVYGHVFSGANGVGAVFELLPPKTSGGKWKEKLIYKFCALTDCADGAKPAAAPIMDVHGNLYGVTFGGGNDNQGTVFELVKPVKHKKWRLKTLVQFCISTSNCDPSNEPLYGLSYAGASSGALYDGKSPLFGVANGGNQFASCNPECGTVYEVALKQGTWSLTTLYQFCAVGFSCSDGDRPTGSLLVDATGSMLTGTVQAAGNSPGALFALKRNGASWTETLPYAFCQVGDCEDGIAPSGGVTPDATGNLFGTTNLGGTANLGVLYKITPGTPYKQQTLYSFCQAADCADGREPGEGNVLIDASGNLFGTTFNGGGHDIDEFKEGGGTLFEFSGGQIHTLYGFCAQPNCADGEYPNGPIAFGPSGTFFGTTEGGGAFGRGSVYQLTP
jgi:uncharacterized repeat protein (TIGR03803 family)